MEKEIRAIGRTTRIVDECIQVLFNTGKLPKSLIELLIKQYHSDLIQLGEYAIKNEMTCIIQKLKARLNLEHFTDVADCGDSYRLLSKDENKIRFQLSDMEKLLQEHAKKQLIKFNDVPEKCKGCNLYSPTKVCSCSK